MNQPHDPTSCGAGDAGAEASAPTFAARLDRRIVNAAGGSVRHERGAHHAEGAAREDFEVLHLAVRQPLLVAGDGCAERCDARGVEAQRA